MELIFTNNAYVSISAVGVDERSEILFLQQIVGRLLERVKTKYGPDVSESLTFVSFGQAKENKKRILLFSRRTLIIG